MSFRAEGAPVYRVAVDATAVPARLTGAGVYVARVLAGLAARDDLEVEAFCAPGSAGVLAAPGLRLRPVAMAGAGRPARIAWTQLRAGMVVFGAVTFARSSLREAWISCRSCRSS